MVSSKEKMEGGRQERGVQWLLSKIKMVISFEPYLFSVTGGVCIMD